LGVSEAAYTLGSMFHFALTNKTMLIFLAAALHFLCTTQNKSKSAFFTLFVTCKTSFITYRG
jgi:hypothetical protein